MKTRDSFDYQRYLASREWALLREAVKRRASITGAPGRAVCERCDGAPVRATHHLTYERIGHEELDDLLGVCGPCHEFLSGKSEDDPLKTLVADAFEEVERCTCEARDWWTRSGTWNAVSSLEAAAYAFRLAQYRILRRAAVMDGLPVTAASIWQRQYPDQAEPFLSADEIRGFAELDRLFVRFPERKAG